MVQSSYFRVLRLSLTITGTIDKKVVFLFCVIPDGFIKVEQP